jgi:NDP-sugar pyrophosphorylase family protein
MLTHYKSAAITEHFRDGESFGVNIDYVLEEEPLGTAGALTLLKTGTDPLLVLNGDILTRTDFTALLDFHKEHQADITVGVREYDFRVPYGVVEAKGVRVTAITEKPIVKCFVNAGIYLLASGIRDHIPKSTRYDMPTLINDQIRDGRAVVTFPVHEYWLDIGHIEDYRKADADVRNGTI